MNKRAREREMFEKRERKNDKKRAAKMAKSLGLKPPDPAPTDETST